MNVSRAGVDYQIRSFKHIVSLGHACAVAGALERYGFREHSGPFDWQASRSLKSRIDCLEDGFTSFMENFTSSNLVQRQVPSCYYYEPCNTFLVHDFNEWSSVDEQIGIVREKYRKRIKVFLNDIKDPTLFLYYLYGEGEDVEYINGSHEHVLRVLKKYNPSNEIIYISDKRYKISCPPPLFLR